MIILKYFINSLDALWRNKLRSALSTLGIVIGVASVSIMMALGEGLKEKMLENLSTSNDTITITEKNTWGGREEETQDKPYFQVKEVMVPSSIELLKKFIPDIKYVIGYGNGYGGSSQFEGKELYSSIVGVSSDYFKAKKLEILAGRGFTNKDFEETKKVVILGSEVVKYNLNGVNPVGKVIMIGGYAFDVIGILDKSTDWNVNYSMIVPYSTAELSAGVKKFENMYIYVDDIQKIESVKKDALFLLMKLSNVDIPSMVKFGLQSNDEIIKQINDSINQLKLFLGGIAGISLLVGGIGIMNIMLVSVIERTREIGIRKAIGARKRDILMQFLIESIVISILGCIIALFVTLLGVSLINKYGGEQFSAVMNLNVLFFASGVSIGMGIIFGLLPAWKASKMKPIDALRFE